MRKPGEIRFAFDCPVPFKHRQNGDAVDDVIPRAINLHSIKDRRIKVDCTDNRIADGPRFNMPRPTHHERNALAALVYAALAFTQRSIAGRRLIPRPFAIALNRVIERMIPVHFGYLRVICCPAVHIAAVIREKDENRVFRKPEIIQCLLNAPETFIHALQHRTHDGIALPSGGIFLLRIPRGVILLVLPGTVNRVMPEIQVKRFILVRLDKLNRLAGQAIGNMFAVGTVRYIPDLVFSIRHAILKNTVRGKVTGRTGIGRAAPRRFKPVLIRAVLRHQAQMPLAEVTRAVTGAFQNLGQGGQFRIEIVLALRIDHFLAGRHLTRIG